MAMEYVAIRAAAGLSGEYWVMGQRKSDLNWDIIRRHSEKREAEKAAALLCKELSKKYHKYMAVYTCSGYGNGYFNGELRCAGFSR